MPASAYWDDFPAGPDMNDHRCPFQCSITGVSLNQQLTQLIQYQNLLQASGRAVQAANDMIKFLIDNVS